MAEQEMSGDLSHTVPKVLLSAWGVEAASRKGPRPKLTVARIVDTAVALGDRHGAAAITMSRTAAELGVGTMSLYRYIESRDDLLLLAVDAALGAPPELAGHTWRERMRSLAWAMRDTYLRHPWASRVPVTREPLAPSFVRWGELGLAVLEETGLPVAERAHILVLLWTYVRAEAELDNEQRRSQSAEGIAPAQADRVFAHRLDSLVPADHYPRIRELLGSDTFTPAGTAANDASEGTATDFAWAVGLIIDGIAARVAD